MGDRRELGGGLAAHPLRRRIRRDEFRPSLLDRREVQEERVVLRVGERGLREDVVAVIRLADEPPQFLGADGFDVAGGVAVMSFRPHRYLPSARKPGAAC